MRYRELVEASGHIPKNEKEAHDPRWSNAITVDIHPGSSQEQAKRMGWSVDPDGIPPLLSPSGAPKRRAVKPAHTKKQKPASK